MTQSLVINGKEYLPSTLLATRFNYTPDYIGKLAREEKILGTLIGRQWFVEPESLSVFLKQAEIAKKMRQEELRLQRKIERQVHQEKSLESHRAAVRRELAALTQTAVVVVCGFMVGGLGFIAAQEGVGLNEFVEGTHDTLAFMASSIVPSAVSPEVVTYSLVAASAEGTRQAPLAESNAALIYTTLPEFPERERDVASTSAEGEVASHFSDEITVVEQGDGTEMIIPVFKRDGGVEQFVVMPVSEDSHYHE